MDVHKETQSWNDFDKFEGTKQKERKCKMCGARLSVFMGKETWKQMLCQNCIKLKKMESSGALARQGLTPLDFM